MLVGRGEVTLKSFCPWMLGPIWVRFVFFIVEGFEVGVGAGS